MELGFAIFIATVAAFAGWLLRDIQGVDTEADFKIWDKGYQAGYKGGYVQAVDDMRFDAEGVHRD